MLEDPKQGEFAAPNAEFEFRYPGFAARRRLADPDPSNPYVDLSRIPILPVLYEPSEGEYSCGYLPGRHDVGAVSWELTGDVRIMSDWDEVRPNRYDMDVLMATLVSVAEDGGWRGVAILDFTERIAHQLDWPVSAPTISAISGAVNTLSALSLAYSVPRGGVIKLPLFVEHHRACDDDSVVILAVDDVLAPQAGNGWVRWIDMESYRSLPSPLARRLYQIVAGIAARSSNPRLWLDKEIARQWFGEFSRVSPQTFCRSVDRGLADLIEQEILADTAEAPGAYLLEPGPRLRRW